VLVLTCEKQGDMLDSFVKTLVEGKFQMKAMEKADRERCVEWLLRTDERLRGV
jgi:hypothetical protein